MCTYTINGPEPKTAERDIECFKVVKVKAGKDGSKTYYPMRYPEFSKAYGVVYLPGSLRGIEARAEGEHISSGTDRILYRTMKSKYYEEDRLYRFEGGWVHGFTRLADAESTARQLLLYKDLYSSKKEGISLEVWRCVVKKGSPYHEGFMKYNFPDRKYMYCVCSESMIFDRMEMIVDDWRSPLMFTPTIVDKEGAEWYLVRHDNASECEWRKYEGNSVILRDGERMDIYVNMCEYDYYDAYLSVMNGNTRIMIEYAGSCIDSFAMPPGVSCKSLRIKKVETPSSGIRISEQPFLNSNPCVTPETGAAALMSHYALVERDISSLDNWQSTRPSYMLNVSEKETIYVRDGRCQLGAK